MYFEFRHMRLSALIEQIFGVHGVQEMFLRLSFSYFNKFSFMDCSVDLSTLSHIKTACSVQVKLLLLEAFPVALHFIFFK